MYLVDDKYFVSVTCRGYIDALEDDRSNLFYLSIGCSVDLKHVYRAAFRDLKTGVADIARFRGARRRGRAVRPAAVQCLGKDAGRCGLTNAACARKQIGMVEPVVLDRIAERTSDVLLAGNFLEVSRPPFSGDNLIRHW